MEGALVSALLGTATAFGADAIGDLTVDGGLNPAGRHVLHALMGGASGSVQAGSDGCAAGAAGGALGELAAGWFNPDGRKGHAETIAFAQLVAGLGGALLAQDGSDAASVNIAATAGGNAAEHNYLSHLEATRLAELRTRQQAGRCDGDCERDLAALQALDAQRNRELAACEGSNSAACQSARQDVRIAAAGYIRAIDPSLDLRVGQERDEALALAQNSMGGIGLANVASGYLQATQEGLESLWHGATTAAQALLGNAQAQAELREGAGQFWDTVKDPQNWPTLLGAMTPQQREELALAYERGDAKAVGQIAGAQVASLPAGGWVGGIKKIGVLPHKPDASSIDIAHTIGADYNSTTGKVTGGHTLINGDVRVREVVSGPDVNGVYVAKVEMKTPDGRWIEKVSNNGENTMFPKDWDAQKVQVEIESAWARRTSVANQPNMWSGTSDSGVKIQGYLEPRTTAYPVRE